MAPRKKKQSLVDKSDEPIFITLPISVLNSFIGMENSRRELEILTSIPEAIQPGIEENYKTVEDTVVSTVVSDYGNSVCILPNEITKGNVNIKLKSDIACWWCCHTFVCQPIFAPYDLKAETYKVKGNFCSFECCLAWMSCDKLLKDKKYLLNYYFKDVTKLQGCLSDCVTPAPGRELLKMFGGPLDIEQFRANNEKFSLVHYSSISETKYIEKKAKGVNTCATKLNLTIASHVSKKKELPSNSLSKLIGLTRK